MIDLLQECEDKSTEGKLVFSTKVGAKITGYPHVKEWN